MQYALQIEVGIHISLQISLNQFLTSLNSLFFGTVSFGASLENTLCCYILYLMSYCHKKLGGCVCRIVLYADISQFKVSKTVLISNTMLPAHTMWFYNWLFESLNWLTSKITLSLHLCFHGHLSSLCRIGQHYQNDQPRSLLTCIKSK